MGGVVARKAFFQCQDLGEAFLAFEFLSPCFFHGLPSPIVEMMNQGAGVCQTEDAHFAIFSSILNQKIMFPCYNTQNEEEL